MSNKGSVANTVIKSYNVFCCNIQKTYVMNIFKGRHYKYTIIIWAVRWYCKYGISYRDLSEMLLERGVTVDHTTIYRWVQYYAPKMLNTLKWYWKPRSLAGE